MNIDRLHILVATLALALVACDVSAPVATHQNVALGTPNSSTILATAIEDEIVDLTGPMWTGSGSPIFINAENPWEISLRADRDNTPVVFSSAGKSVNFAPREASYKFFSSGTGTLKMTWRASQPLTHTSTTGIALGEVKLLFTYRSEMTFEWRQEGEQLFLIVDDNKGEFDDEIRMEGKTGESYALTDALTNAGFSDVEAIERKLQAVIRTTKAQFGVPRGHTFQFNISRADDDRVDLVWLTDDGKRGDTVTLTR